MPRYFLLLLFFAPFLTACEEVFEYHPNQIRLSGSERDLTARNVEKIQQLSPDDTIRIVVMGDTQRFYDSAEEFVKAANKLDNIDFVVHQGDISDFGMTQEFRWIHDIMKDLRVPYLTVIGNHDLLANGKKVYQQMYGDLNYAFVYGRVKFIFLDTNGREYDFSGNVPDLAWLQGQLTHTPESDWKQAVIISHMSPFGGDYDSRLRLPFHQVLEQSGRVHLSLHGHEHNWQTIEQEESNITYHMTTSTNNKGFSYVEIWDGGFSIKRIHY
ncbi:metallophosphoesterase family protein [Pontibacter kalidii]|uniref:metallophosphoesterase family protein n=1 Tax=Pontibacter kalidii TaxID=2592049 RepID=UPI0022545BB2|nr:metallophosphoesterase [Pontibacter kalidii]